MRHYYGVFIRQHVALYCFVFFVMFFSLMPIVTAAGGENNMDDKVVSLTVKDEPLGEVLRKISSANGCEFILDNKWISHRVTADLEKVSLNLALIRILRDLNHVIIYDSDQKIKIIIYGKIESKSVSSVPSTAGSSARMPEPELPASQAVEKDESSDANAVSGRKFKSRALINKRKKRHRLEDMNKEE